MALPRRNPIGHHAELASLSMAIELTFSGLPLIVFQLCLLLTLVAGWGFWTWRVLRGHQTTRRFHWLFAGLAGYVVQLIALDAVARLGIPARVSTWALLAVAAAGTAFGAGHVCRAWTSLSSRARSDALGCVIVFAVSFAIQSTALLRESPENYYGKGRTDQLIWVSLAQYLVERGSPGGSPDSGHPWAAKATAMQTQRTVHAAATAELAVASLTDAKSAYGAQSVFFAALLPAAVFAVFRSFAVWAPLALMGSLWVGVLPALAKIHLDGFFAQLSVLFAFPLILAACRCGLDRSWRDSVLIATYAAWVFSAYTDFYPFAVVLVALLVATGWARRDRWWPLHVLLIGIVSLLLSGLYLRKGIALFLYHLSVANAKLPELEGLVPTAGTLWGWFQIFSSPLAAGAQDSYRIAVLCTLAASLVAISAFFSRSLRTRYQLAAAIAGPLAYLCVVVSSPDYPKYPSWKISTSFAWLFAVLIVLGLYRLCLIALSRTKARVTTLVMVYVFLWVAYAGCIEEMDVVFRQAENLSILNRPALRAAFAHLETHPGSTVMIRDENPIVVGWLSYHGRHSRVYVDRDAVPEGYLPPGDWSFYAVPPDLGAGVVVSSEGVQTGRVPSVAVRNQQGRDWNERELWYWMADTVDFSVLADHQSVARSWVLEFLAIPGPGNPAPVRKLALTSANGASSIVEIHGAEMIRIPVTLQPGRTTFRLQILWPTEQIVSLPNDSRKLMVRISHVAIRDVSS
jgi:hypothetical protein